MRILDLFCGAGGAAMGYHRAFPDAEIVGVDIAPQPRYPFKFVQSDAMKFALDGFDLIHASPPCHDHSTAGGRRRREAGAFGTGWMLAAVIERFLPIRAPWMVENVAGARPAMAGAPHLFRLCGSSFGLDVQRHRWFASNCDFVAPPCDHSWQTPRFRSLNYRKAQAGELARVVGVHGSCNYAGEFPIRCAAMQIDWMTNSELTQSIPPAYTEWIGKQFADAVRRAA